LGEGKDAFATFQQFNQSATKVLLSQATYANWLANRPYRSQRRPFFNEDYGDDWPDQCRATALPKTAQLIKNGWEQLFPAALKKSGSLKMRGYLRELTKTDAPLKDIAAPRLVEVDQLVIKYYFAQAKVLLRKHQFDATRKMYKRIIAEYPSDPAAKRAEKEMGGISRIAVNYYKKEGDRNWNSVGHMGVPQKKSQEFYRAMYKENPDGSQADYALYYWARALGTVGKIKEEIKLLKQHLGKFPKSKIRSKVLYELGFVYAGLPINDHKKGIEIFEEVVNTYPHSKEAPESLWHEAFLFAIDQHFDKAIPLLQQLKAQYPKSLRTQWVDVWVAKYQKILKGEDHWP